MANASGAATRRSQRDKERAADMRRRGVERTTGRCPNCYRIVVCESSRSRNTHIYLCQG